MFFLKAGALAALGLMGAAMAHPAFAGPAGTNDYGGYDIAGRLMKAERVYGKARGWTVYVAGAKGRFAYCVGETKADGQRVRIGYDGMQWQLAVPVRSRKDWSGTLTVDGDGRPTSGTAVGRWTIAWLQLPELDRLRAGNEAALGIGKADYDFSLAGTAATVTKVDECVKRNAPADLAQGELMPLTPARPAAEPQKPRKAQKAQKPRNNQGQCRRGKPLPFTGLCQAEARKLLRNRQRIRKPAFIAPKGCDWAVNEVRVIDHPYLYLALRCNGTTSRLDYAGGAHRAELSLVTSALRKSNGENPRIDNAEAAIWIYTIDPAKRFRSLMQRSREGLEPGDKPRLCRIYRAPGLRGTFVYGGDPAELAKAGAKSYDAYLDAVPSCGLYSSNGDTAQKYWMPEGDEALFMTISDEAYQDIDPLTLSRVEKSPSGEWTIVR